MNAQENMQKWIYALRSGKYAQAHGKLRRVVDSESNPSGFCCLGVMCDLYDSEAWDDGFWGGDESDMMPPKYVLEKFGMNDDWARAVAELNDNGSSFEEIANRVESIYLPKVSEDS